MKHMQLTHCFCKFDQTQWGSSSDAASVVHNTIFIRSMSNYLFLNDGRLFLRIKLELQNPEFTIELILSTISIADFAVAAYASLWKLKYLNQSQAD